MKKLFVFLGAVIVMMIFQFCGPRKNAQVAVPKLTYEHDVQPLIATKCTPCHIPPRGNKKPYATYDAAKEDIDEMIRRVQLNPTDRGFMPFKKMEKLPDSVIHVLVQWKADGLREK
ncbi:MAG: hypothetical protein ABIX01_10870 [Chitinophagaceae bacterium]